jgi:hypothetical protein
MTFASPLWLLGLLPWAAVAIWLLLGRHRRVAVPFIPLWRGPVSPSRAKPSIKRPPLAVILAVLSLLLAVVAASRPMLRRSAGPAVTIIVDRGITMSARGAHIERFKETCDRLAAALPSGPVRLIVVPGDETASLNQANWHAAVAAMPPTDQKSQPELDAAIRRCLADRQTNLIVVTDQAVVDDRRVIRIEPETAVSNLTITDVAARASPRAQVMVELRDQNCVTSFRKATVHVESGTNSATQKVQIPRDGTMTAFVDLPALDAIVSVSVDAPDDLPADNQAWLAREQSTARIEQSPSLPEPLRRMIAVYRRNRSAGGPRVQIVTNLADVPSDEPAIVLAPDWQTETSSASSLHVENHALTAIVDWAALTTDARGGTAPAGWRVLVLKGSASFLAVRDGPVPAVWVCVNSPQFPLRADYVIFWTNVFGLLGGDGSYRWHSVHGDVKPGIEKEGDGSVKAFNAIDVKFPPLIANDWAKLQSLDRRSAGDLDLTPYVCLISLVLVVAAIAITRSPLGRG